MDPHSVPPPARHPERTPSPRPRTRLHLVVGAGLVLLLVAGGVVGWVLWSGGPGGGETVELRVGGGEVAADSAEMDRVVEILGRRIAGMGHGEPAITPGPGTVTVELPPDVDTAEAVALMERPGAMTIHPVSGVVDESAEPPSADEPVLAAPDSSERLRLGPARLGNERVESTTAEFNASFSQWEVLVEFTDEGAGEWARVTGEAACLPPGDPGRRIAIVVDGEVVSAPEVGPDVACETGLTSGATVISGDFTRDDVVTLANLIGADPLPVEVAEAS
ncbi:hypothetical protein PWG71_15800 [Nocardiopsis sp. N85]|uniref:SecDF P1 head subdomain-containing protein n=1 Tax=Nocardiopsis sp. N85 TaxID=3029400 RepID=UPI00237F3F5C|nr:hypothetical protein [Nocardiopsis sp. N85]MDE3722853.1 hypothetical protein [Nocardiopsis sp. N85]